MTMPMNITLGELHAMLPGSRLVGLASTRVDRVHTDTRTLADGDLFVALKGERFDAGDFLAQARQSGAVAAVAHGGLEDAGLPGLLVPDTLAALGALAHAWRRRWRLPVVAVTGSNGKTTVTQMIGRMFQAAAGDAALVTAGNFNNAIGVPLTLLRLRAHHTLAVVELGMNHPGEIACLAHMTAPTVALVNNAQREHQEFMGTVDAVARENGTVLTALANAGVAVFPAADAYTPIWSGLVSPHCTVTTFALHDAVADVRCVSALWVAGAWQVQAHTPMGPVSYTLAVAGWHNVLNSLAALACALAAGVTVQTAVAGLSAFSAVKGRSRSLQLQLGSRCLDLVDDTYNANPDSVRAAIDVLLSLPAPRLLVLGDMGEVGDQGPAFHREMGDYAAACGIDHVLTLGSLARHTAVATPCGEHQPDMASLIRQVQARAPLMGSVLIKGSRFMRMEQVVDALLAMATPISPEASCS
jgi:UDP-N-acetylmuramoyl-tripeptide--D-alanyl-D-alanine ligase